jgi:hypothetical protein
MFIQGKRPALILSGTPEELRVQIERAVAALSAEGYVKHGGLRVTRRGELLALRNCFYPGGSEENRRTQYQNHVQLVAMPDDTVAIFGHIEPYGHGVAHLYSAVLDKADFAAGARMLRRHLGVKP